MQPTDTVDALKRMVQQLEGESRVAHHHAAAHVSNPDAMTTQTTLWWLLHTIESEASPLMHLQACRAASSA